MMNVLVSTKKTQNDEPNDVCWVPEGELVARSGVVCDGEREDGTGCGCGRTFAGLVSRTSTTTAMVVQMDITEQEWRKAVLLSLDGGGWSALLTAEECAQIIDELVESDLKVIQELPPGTVLGRHAWIDEEGMQDDCFVFRRPSFELFLRYHLQQ